uniref:Recombination signal binding protein for immunoglobulin kappa J region like n=1 Tax=Amphilophus citrinellus TaxID=61819 RepID=A0A3Q0THD9_AMPCI
MFACAKSLFISDQDKRKHFCLLLRLFLGNRQEVGSFQSRMIKVISKPSQKRQSMKNADCEFYSTLQSNKSVFQMCLSTQHRLTSSLIFNFILIIMKLCDGEQESLGPSFSLRNVDEPVSQLHKCAFQFRDSPHAYLCLTNDAIIQYQAPYSVRDPSKVMLNDGSCWTIIGVEVVEFNFSHGLTCITTPVSPFPAVTGLECESGRNFATWKQGQHQSPKSLLCVVPDVSVLSDGWRCLRRIVTVPLSLVRQDGLIYRTSYSFTYTPELQPPPVSAQILSHMTSHDITHTHTHTQLDSVMSHHNDLPPISRSH